MSDKYLVEANEVNDLGVSPFDRDKAVEVVKLIASGDTMNKACKQLEIDPLDIYVWRSQSVEFDGAIRHGLKCRARFLTEKLAEKANEMLELPTLKPKDLGVINKVMERVIQVDDDDQNLRLSLIKESEKTRSGGNLIVNTPVTEGGVEIKDIEVADED